MTVVGQAFIKVKPQTDDFEKETSSAIGGAFKKVAAVAAGALAGAGVVNFFRESATAASDFGESASKAANVFGPAIGEVEKFASTAASAIGQSQGQALAAAGTFGNLFTALGATQQAAAGMSVDTLQLGADLASFNNLGVDETLEKLRSGLVGEIEPLRSLGISFDAAAVEAKAAELGLAGANGEISEGAKVQARLALITEQSKNALGDFGETAGGLANSQRILAATFKDVQEQVGKALLPALLQIVDAAKPLLASLKPILDILGSALATALKAVAPLIESLQPVLQVVGRSFANIVASIAPLIPSLGRLVEAFAPIIGTVLGTFGLLLDAIVPVLVKLVDALAPVIEMVGEALGDAMESIAPLIETASDVIVQLLDALMPLVPTLAQLLVALVPLIPPIVQMSLAFLQLLPAVIPIIDALVKLLNAVLVPLIPILTRLTTEFGQNFSKAMQQVAAIVPPLTERIRGIVAAITNFVTAIPGAIKGAINFATSLVDAGKNLISGFIEGIRSGAARIIKAIRETITDRLPGFVKSALGISSPSTMFAELGAAVAAGFAGGIRAGQGDVDRAVSALTRVPSTPGSLSPATAGAGLGGAGGATVIVYPTPGMSEAEVGRVAARELVWATK